MHPARARRVFPTSFNLPQRARGNIMQFRKHCTGGGRDRGDAAVRSLTTHLGIEPPRSAEHHAHADGGFDRLLPVQQLRAGPRRLRHAARELHPAAGRRMAALTISRWTRRRCTRSTSTTTATRSENLTFQFRFTNRLANDNRGIKLNIGGTAGRRAAQECRPASARPTTRALNFRESYQLWLVRGDRRHGKAPQVTGASGGTVFGKPYDFVGTKTFGSVASYQAYANSFIYTINVPGCDMPGRVFVGQRKEGVRGEPRPRVRPREPGAGRGRQRARRGDGGVPGRHHAVTRQQHRRQRTSRPSRSSCTTSCLKGSGNGVIGGWTSASCARRAC